MLFLYRFNEIPRWSPLIVFDWVRTNFASLQEGYTKPESPQEFSE